VILQVANEQTKERGFIGLVSNFPTQLDILISDPTEQVISNVTKSVVRSCKHEGAKLGQAATRKDTVAPVFVRFEDDKTRRFETTPSQFEDSMNIAERFSLRTLVKYSKYRIANFVSIL